MTVSVCIRRHGCSTPSGSRPRRTRAAPPDPWVQDFLARSCGPSRGARPWVRTCWPICSDRLSMGPTTVQWPAQFSLLPLAGQRRIHLELSVQRQQHSQRSLHWGYHPSHHGMVKTNSTIPFDLLQTNGLYTELVRLCFLVSTLTNGPQLWGGPNTRSSTAPCRQHSYSSPSA